MRNRPLRFGLDFGTSNTALAVRDGGRVTVLPLDPVAGELLGRRFPQARLRDMARFSGVAAGLAVS